VCRKGDVIEDFLDPETFVRTGGADDGRRSEATDRREPYAVP
jgi:hypothetical protein